MHNLYTVEGQIELTGDIAAAAVYGKGRRRRTAQMLFLIPTIIFVAGFVTQYVGPGVLGFGAAGLSGIAVILVLVRSASRSARARR